MKKQKFNQLKKKLVEKIKVQPTIKLVEEIKVQPTLKLVEEIKVQRTKV